MTMTIAQHRVFTGGFLGVLGIVAGTAFGFFVVEESQVSVLWLRPVFHPIMGFLFVFSSYVSLSLLWSRGKILVGGEDWIAEYHFVHPFPVRNRVTVSKTKGMVMRVEPIRPLPKYRGLEGWVELIVIQNGREVIRTVANPKWLKDDYEETFEQWKSLTPPKTSRTEQSAVSIAHSGPTPPKRSSNEAAS